MFSEVLFVVAQHVLISLSNIIFKQMLTSCKGQMYDKTCFKTMLDDDIKKYWVTKNKISRNIKIIYFVFVFVKSLIVCGKKVFPHYCVKLG